MVRKVLEDGTVASFDHDLSSYAEASLTLLLHIRGRHYRPGVEVGILAEGMNRDWDPSVSARFTLLATPTRAQVGVLFGVGVDWQVAIPESDSRDVRGFILVGASFGLLGESSGQEESE